MPSGIYKRKSKKIKIVCQYCDKIREVYPCIIKMGYGKFCSLKCFRLLQTEKKHRKKPPKVILGGKLRKRYPTCKYNKRLLYERKYNRRKNSLKWRLNRRISGGIWCSLKNGSKNGRHWEDLVLYNLVQFKKNLEKQFDEFMNWNNYGTYWHIDHIIPISAFNFNKPEDLNFKRCWALSNLRPLEKKENFTKGAKLTKSFQINFIAYPLVICPF